MADRFQFELGQKVKLALSVETGIITGRAEYQADGSKYYVRYLNAQGAQVESWWDEDAIVAAE